jgi:hypothetical protein
MDAILVGFSFSLVLLVTDCGGIYFLCPVPSPILGMAANIPILARYLRIVCCPVLWMRGKKLEEKARNPLRGILDGQ